MHRTTISSLAASVALLLPLGGLAAQASPCAAKPQAASTALDSAIIAAMATHGVPGAAVVTVRHGRVEYLAGFGCANIAKGVSVDPRRTVFHVASVSKPFVALAVAQLADQGRVDLHADVNRYLRTMQVPSGWDRAVTLHDLLTHTAGFEESVVGYAARTPADIKPLGEFLAAKLPKRGWPPGRVTAYSNYGYALAGYVVESVSGMSFADYERAHVLEPLGMTRSSFHQPMPPDLERDAAVSYRCSEGSCEPITPDYRSAYPPGGLVTTAEDMSRFLLAHLRAPLDVKQGLSDSVLTLMHTRQFTNDSLLPGSTYGFSEDQATGERALSHAGGASGYTSFVIFTPARDFGAFLVANGGSSRFGADVLEIVTRGEVRPVAEVPRVRSSLDPTGAYRSTRYAHRGVENLAALFSGQLHVTRVGDTLEVAGLGDANGKYLPIGETRWEKIDGRRDRIAVRVTDGQVTHLFGSQSFFGTRVPATFERLEWYDAPHFMNEALSWLLATPILALLAWPIIAGIVWLVRRRTKFVAHLHPAPSTSRVYAVVAAVLFIAIGTAFGFGFIAQTNRAAERGGGDLIYGLPTNMQVLAYAPVTIAILACVLVVAAFVGWRRRWWSVPGSLTFMLIAVNAVLYVALVVRWGYFPVATG
jgi:CubicO group peptidase (beta-lactamase class C family)